MDLIKSSPEISFTIDKMPFLNDKFAITYVNEISVDPMTLNSKILLEEVINATHHYDQRLSVMVKERQSVNKEAYQALVDIIAEGNVEFNDFISSIDRANHLLTDFASEVQEKQIEWLYRRFANYLYEGTILELDSSLFSLDTKFKDKKKN